MYKRSLWSAERLSVPDYDWLFRELLYKFIAGRTDREFCHDIKESSLIGSINSQ